MTAPKKEHHNWCFSWKLGNCDTEPTPFQLKEGVKSYSGKAFSIPKIHAVTMKRKWNAYANSEY